MNLFENQEKKFIKDLQVGGQVDNYYKLMFMDKRTKKDGGVFLTLELMDKTGKIPAKVWSNAETSFKILKPGGIYRIKGNVGEYMNKKEIKVSTVRPVSPSDTDFNAEDYVESSSFDTDALFARLLATIKSHLSNPHLVRLTDLFAEKYGDKFKIHYGAQKIHHAYLGGLLEHTHSMVEIAVFIAKHYALDKELLLMGTLFHDVGKIFEFDISPAPQATMAGGLIGHIVIGTGIVRQLTAKIEGFSPELSAKIQHLIISHHGHKDFGSPETPAFPEAFALHAIDLLDSHLAIMEEGIKNSETPGLFTDYIHVLGRRLYKEKG
ncbi:MAG: HD domain-containing protein [bacterium]|nr:HD domain-containing protein [bacterium]